MMKKIINVAARSVTFTFDDLPDVTMHAERMSAANYDYAVLHGLSARIGDAAAIPKSAENGFKVTESMRREEVAAMVTHYERPECVEWNLRVGTRAPKQNARIAELAEALGLTYEETQAKLVEDAMKALGA
jgi:hypothetical protein